MIAAVDRSQSPSGRAQVVYHLAVATAATALFGFLLATNPVDPLDWQLLAWVSLVATVELVATQPLRSLGLNLSTPLVVAVGLLHPPAVAGLVAVAATFDRHEPWHGLVVHELLFRRARAGLCGLAGAVCAEAVLAADLTWPVVTAAFAATVVVRATHAALTVLDLRLRSDLSWREAARQQLGRSLVDQAAGLLILSVAGALTVRIALAWGELAVILGVLAGLATRHLYWRNRALADQLAERNELLTSQAEQLREQNALLARQAAQLERLLAEVRDKEERFRALVQNASDVIIVLLPDSTVTYQTPSAERVFGYGPRELVGTRLIDVLHPDDQRRAQAWLAETARAEGPTPPVEWRMRHPRGRWQHVEVTASNLLDDRRVGGIVLTVRSVEERRALTEQLRHQAFHDSLTGLANRSLFRDRVGHALRRRSARTNSVAVMLLDLDDFKVVNDSLGHQSGDQLLVIVAERLRACLRPMDTAARLGGDEFAVLLEDVNGVDGAIEVAERIIDMLRLPVLVGGHEVFVHASLGIATNSGETATDDLLRDADLAMYAAKAKGKGTYEVFRPDLHTATVERMQLTADLQLAIDRGQLVVRFQPVVDLLNGGVAGIEALLRWQHAERGLLPPGAFVPLAEDSGLIVPIGQWILGQACEHAARWTAGQGSAPWVSVNLSAKQLAQPDLAEQVGRVLERTGLPPEMLVLELTESLLMQESDTNVARLHDLKRLGVRLAIDDFGTGYSSLSYLRQFPVDILKIGKAFIDELIGKPGDGALAEAIINLGHTLQLATVAEGVVTEAQVDRLRSLGCHFAQGFHFFEPLPAGEVDRVLATSPRAPRPSPAPAGD